jgi:hypothetical protein
MIISETVENAAQEAGLFVIKRKGDTIEIINKPDYKPREWEV